MPGNHSTASELHAGQRWRR